MPTQKLPPLFLVILTFAAPSCKKAETPSSTQPSEASDSTQVTASNEDLTKPTGSSETWAHMDRKQRKRYMGKTVLPEMAKLFQGFNAQEFNKFTCQTCHGSNWTDPAVDFKMPNSLYPLPKDNPVQAAMEYDAEVTAFMMEQVVPQMAHLLGKTPYDPATGTGDFGCFNCHAME